MGQEGGFPLVAVAISKDRSSQNALKWAADNHIAKGKILTLLHVNTQASDPQQYDSSKGYQGAVDLHMKEFFKPFRCFCSKKDINCKEIVVEDHDVIKAVIEFVAHAAIEKLVIGASSHNGFMRFRSSEISTNIYKSAPDFCTVYVISKGKLQCVRNSVRPAPVYSPLRAQIQSQANIQPNSVAHTDELGFKGDMTPKGPRKQQESIKSPFTRGSHGEFHADYSQTESDVSIASSGRPSFDRAFLPRLSNHSNSHKQSLESTQTPMRSTDSYFFGNEFSYNSGASSATSSSTHNTEDVEAEVKRLRLELKATMEMYSTACKEALLAKQKALDLDRWKVEENQKLEEARVAEQSALALVVREKAKRKAAMEAAEMQHRIAELEIQKRKNIVQALKEAKEMNNSTDGLVTTVKYRRYTLEEIEMATNHFSESFKIGEGGYGTVYGCYLDHTPVAVKVLRQEAAQGRTQFQQEVEVLSSIRHPHMVLLLGACPELGCLVYEHMPNGSLDDRLFRRGNTLPISWQDRFRIAAEIATGLLFLHQTKPKPLVHRDLKPGNILLDRNLVSKIGDVGLARLIPPSAADNVTQYRMTSAAGTFCYIDPEYQQTGMLGVKSDIYSFGIMLLQIITAKPPMGLAYHVSNAIENGTFSDLLDPSISDWPVDEAMKFAKTALKCAEFLRKDRPDLATVVLPELNRLRSLGEENEQHCELKSPHNWPNRSQVSIQDTTAGRQWQSEQEI